MFSLFERSDAVFTTVLGVRTKKDLERPQTLRVQVSSTDHTLLRLLASDPLVTDIQSTLVSLFMYKIRRTKMTLRLAGCSGEVVTTPSRYRVLDSMNFQARFTGSAADTRRGNLYPANSSPFRAPGMNGECFEVNKRGSGGSFQKWPTANHTSALRKKVVDNQMQVCSQTQKCSPQPRTDLSAALMNSQRSNLQKSVRRSHICPHLKRRPL